MMMMKIKTKDESKLNDGPGSTYDLLEDGHIHAFFFQSLCFQIGCDTYYQNH